MSSFPNEANDILCSLGENICEEDRIQVTDNGHPEYTHNAKTSPRKMNRSISESVQYKNCDSSNDMPHNLKIRLQTSGQGMPSEVDCICEEVSQDANSVQYSCEYQLSTNSPKRTNRTKTRKVGRDMTDSGMPDVQEDHIIEDCIQGTKRMTIENLPAARIQGKFSLNIPYVFITYY